MVYLIHVGDLVRTRLSPYYLPRNPTVGVVKNIVRTKGIVELLQSGVIVGGGGTRQFDN